MKRYLLICLLFCLSVAVFAKEHSVSYTYKALAAEGCGVKYSLSKQDTTYYLIVTVTSDRMLFTSEPKIKIRTFNADDNEVIELTGTPLANGSQSTGIAIGIVIIPFTDIITTAQFKIDEMTLEKFRYGIKKIRITLSPMNHERVFKRDKIGRNLYRFYQELAQEKEDEF